MEPDGPDPSALTRTKHEGQSDMDILKTSTDWARAELLSNGFFVLFGVMFIVASFGFWQSGETEMARAFVIPTLVAGGLLLILGGGLLYATWTTAAGFEAAFTQDPAGLVAAEIARADRTMAQYGLAVFRVMPLLIAGAAVLIVVMHGPGWRAAMTTAIIFLGLAMAIDSNANARMSSYKAALLAAQAAT